MITNSNWFMNSDFLTLKRIKSIYLTCYIKDNIHWYWMKYKIFKIEFFIFGQWETGTTTFILLKQERTLTVRLN